MLLVDPSVEDARFVRDLLAHRDDFRVQSARSLEEAESLLGEGAFDAALVEAAWWSEDGGPARDYFRIEDIAGHRFWLFRAGLYREIEAPRWFMHGLFG